MYTPRGHGLSEVGDIEVFPAGDELHLFHLTLPNHDVVQHAVSADGLAWRPLPAALRTGDPGDCDDDQIWTMSVTERAGAYHMLYTALGRTDDGLVQRTALARSTDLIRWEKDPGNPIGAADPRWYEADPAESGSVSWRDPKPTRVGDSYYAMVAARERSGPLLRRGCVGLLVSRDLESWEVQPPLFAPRRYWDLECPQVFTVADRTSPAAYYLTAAIMEDRSQRYWVAPRFEGPYEVPADGGILAPAGHYAGRVCRWRDLDLLWCWHRTALSTGWLATPATVDWMSPRNPFGKFVVAPLVLRRRADGSLSRHSFPGWLAYREAEPTPARPMPTSLFRDRPLAAGGGWRVDGIEGGMDLLATAEAAGDVWLEGTLRFDARSGGLVFRLDGLGGGYFVELREGSAEVTLAKWLPVVDPSGSCREASCVELQRGRLPHAIGAGDRVPFRLLVVGPYVECSLGGEVVLAELSAERLAGQVGLWAESGSVGAGDLHWAPMRRPAHG